MANLDEHFNFLQSIKQDEFNIKPNKIILDNGMEITSNITTGLAIVDKFTKDFKLHNIREEKIAPDKILQSFTWVVPEYVIQYLHPDNIDIKEFWKKSVELFPYLSICGSDPNILTTAQAIEGSFRSQKFLKTLDWLDESIAEGSKVLEIGPGFGMVYEKIIKNYAGLEGNYYSIDVNPLFWHDNMYFCDGRNIPDEIPNDLDVVYSVNVFQHLSSSQRESYYKQIFNKLKPGGTFIVGTFCITSNNIDKPLWGHQDENGNFYTLFLGQYTEIERIDGWLQKLTSIGFVPEKAVEHQNYVCLKLKKP